jgi:hypothetical protein
MTDPTFQPGVHQEEVNISTKWVSWVAFGLLIVGLIWVAIAAALLPSEPGTVPTPGPVVNHINTGPIDQQARGLNKARAAQRRLRQLGWANQAQGIAHVPLEDAKQMWLEESAARARERPESPGQPTEAPAEPAEDDR